MATTKYPWDIWSAVRKQTMSVEAHLFPAEAFPKDPQEEGESPLTGHSGYSRFVVTVINAEKVALSANIPIREIAGIDAKTKFAATKQFEYDCRQKSEGVSPAYTVKITTGTFKGKTPAEVLLENPANREKLTSHYNWLKENLAKYPNNKHQMEAIIEASNLEKAGNLKGEVSDTGYKPSVKIYEAPMRPLASKKREEDGKWLVYEFYIKWNVGDNYPVSVEIVNYYAPVEKKPDGTLNVKVSERDNESIRKNEMKLTAEEWLNANRSINSVLSQFEMLHAKSNFDAARRADKENYEKAKSAKVS